MKPVMLLVAGILLFLGTGLVSAGPAPDLSGTWIEEMVDGYIHSGERFNTTSAGDYWIITQQDGLITGTNFFTTPGGEVVEEPVAGVVSPEGTVLSLVDSSGGTYTATLTGDDTLQVQYLNTGDRKEESGYAFAFRQILKRAE